MNDKSFIQLQQVTKIYHKGSLEIKAVNQVSLTIHSGEFLSIMGPSGCGKTSLLHLLGGLEPPTIGEVIFNDVDLAKMGDRELSHFRNRNVGFVFQSYNLLAGLKVLENVMLPLHYAGYPKQVCQQRALEAVRQLGVETRLDHYPAELSGGEEQRVAIARALVTKPQILLADEPTSNLDSANRDQILDLFRKFHALGTTILLVSHDPKVTTAAQRTLQMMDGQLKGNGKA